MYMNETTLKEDQKMKQYVIVQTKGECLPTHIIQTMEGLNSTQADLSPVPPVLCAPITEQT